MTCRPASAAAGLAGLCGWRRNLAAYGLGACATLTLAPFYLFPLLVPAYAGLYLLLEGAPSARRKAWDGWWWGWGYYMTGLYWFCIALLTDAEKFAWLIPFALFGLTGVIALYSAAACLCMAWVGRYIGGAGRLLAFALVWSLTELARGHLFTGFPWNLPGYSFGFSEASLQLASLVGVYGLSFAAVLLGVSPLFACCGRPGRAAAAACWLLLAAGIAWGSARLPAAAQPVVEGVRLRLVQAHIAQPHKWDPARQRAGMESHIRLMNGAGIENITHIIWPETAVPYVVQPGSPLARRLGMALPPGRVLLTGGLRAEGEDDAGMRIWNSLMAVDHEGNRIGVYDKAHLVPFGEFQPLRDYVPRAWMTPVGDRDFSWGVPSPVVEWAGLPPLLPLICYESIFPGMAENRDRRPDWLLNVTNDAWFGRSTGPHQHFQMSRMRAVEQGVPLVRAANTGISAVVDPYGRVTALLPLGHRGVLDASLPQPLDAKTIYSKYRRWLLPLLALAVLGVACTLRKSHPGPVDFACKLQ